jgi:catechol 2,3-dioxygenase-like lactoylglutathione lyase family enzyme
MQQQISVITLGIADLARSRRFYAEGFGWTPVFENEEIVFYQMNGFVLGTWMKASLEGDMRRPTVTPGAFALAHNVPSR